MFSGPERPSGTTTTALVRSISLATAVSRWPSPAAIAATSIQFLVNDPRLIIDESFQAGGLRAHDALTD